MKSRPSPSSNDGFILVAVLWMLALLCALATAASAYISNSAVGLRVGNEQLQIDALFEAALELTIYQRAADKSASTFGAFEFSLAGAKVNVEFVPESARIDLNAAPKAMLAGLFASVGAPQEQSEYYADRIIAWRTLAKDSDGNDEQSLYRKAGLSYAPRQGPFTHCSELWLVVGLPHGLVQRVLPIVTVYSGRSDVNAFAAPAQVIASIPGIPRDRINAFLLLRQAEKPDWLAALQALGRDQSLITTAASDSVHVTVQVSLRSSRNAKAEVTILPTRNASYRILSWSDNRDNPSPRLHAMGMRAQ